MARGPGRPGHDRGRVVREAAPHRQRRALLPRPRGPAPPGLAARELPRRLPRRHGGPRGPDRRRGRRRARHVGRGPARGRHPRPRHAPGRATAARSAGPRSACAATWRRTASIPASCRRPRSSATTASTSASPTASASPRSPGSPATPSPVRACRSAAVPGTVAAPTSCPARPTAAWRGARCAPASSCSATTTRTAARRPRPPRRLTATGRSWSGASSARTSRASGRGWPTPPASTGYDAGLLAAKVIGRWPDGSPLILRPRVRRPRRSATTSGASTTSATATTRTGFACPRGAHIRRANPRDALRAGGRLTARHRILRRGMPYGEPFDPAERRRHRGPRPRVRRPAGEHRAPVRDRPGALAERRRRVRARSAPPTRSRAPSRARPVRPSATARPATPRRCARSSRRAAASTCSCRASRACARSRRCEHGRAGRSPEGTLFIATSRPRVRANESTPPRRLGDRKAPTP